MDFFMGTVIGATVGLVWSAFIAIPHLERLREENGKLRIDLRYAKRKAAREAKSA